MSPLNEPDAADTLTTINIFSVSSLLRACKNTLTLFNIRETFVCLIKQTVRTSRVWSAKLHVIIVMRIFYSKVQLGAFNCHFLPISMLFSPIFFLSLYFVTVHLRILWFSSRRKLAVEFKIFFSSHLFFFFPFFSFIYFSLSLFLSLTSVVLGLLAMALEKHFSDIFSFINIIKIVYQL